MPRRRQQNSTLPVYTKAMKRGAGLNRGPGPSRTSGLKRSERAMERAAGAKARRKTRAQRERDAARKAAEFARKYHSEERVIFVKFAMHCAVPHCPARPENAHLDTEGTGRKAHYTRIAPLCRGHHRTFAKSLHNLGSVEAFDVVHDTDLESTAAVVERVWQTKGPGWIAQAKADGSYEAMRRAA